MNATLSNTAMQENIHYEQASRLQVTVEYAGNAKPVRLAMH